MNHWSLIIGMMVLTFGPRLLPIALATRFKIPPLLQQALEFVPIAVLSAIIAQTSFYQDSELNLSFDNYYLYGLAAAVITAWLTKHTFLTIVIGLIAYVMAFKLL